MTVLGDWFVGFVCALGYVEINGGWYQYAIARGGTDVERMVNREGWQLMSSSSPFQLRRPRDWLPRLPSIDGLFGQNDLRIR